MHLFHTGTLPNAPSHMESFMGQSASRLSGEVVPEPRSYVSEVTMARSRSVGRRPSGPRNVSGRSLGRPSSNNAPDAAQVAWHGAVSSPPPAFHSETPPRISSAPHRASPGPHMGPHQNAPQQHAPQYSLYNNMLEGNAAAAMQQPARSGQPWIMVSQTSEGPSAPNSRGGSMPASPRNNAAFNGALPGEYPSMPGMPGDDYAINMHQQRARTGRSSRGHGSGVGEGVERCTPDHMHAGQSVSHGGHAHAVCEGRESAAIPGVRIQGSPEEHMLAVGAPPRRTAGEGLPIYDGYNVAGLSYIDEGMSTMTGPSGLDLAHPHPQRQSFLGGTGHMGGNSDAIASEHLPGVPTISRPMDPGSYNQANAMLRKQLPHYQVCFCNFYRYTGSVMLV